MLSLHAYQYVFLILSLITCFLSLLSFHKGKEKLSVALLIAGALVIRLFMITIDPFLHDWDERFHALVAKNMISDPFTPMLYVHPALPYNYAAWCCNHIWIHKQPVFLWQMALSMKVFGVNEVALRLPSAILGAIQVFFVFRVGKLLQNAAVGFYGAFFFALSFYQLQLTAGIGDMDHHRIVFGFYVAASIWAYAEYLHSKKISFAIWAGVFAGLAVLNMWLAGLIVYGGWAVAWLFFTKFNLKTIWSEGKKEIPVIFLSLLVAVVVFLPWQVYTHIRFPQESANEMEWNRRHISEVLEGHQGPWYYYILQLPMHFGLLAYAIIPLALLAMIKFSRNKSLLITLLFCLSVTYLFFSLVVQTRMPSYMYMVSFIIWIAIGSLFYNAFERIGLLKPLRQSTLGITTIIFLFATFFTFQINSVLKSKLLLIQVGNDPTYTSRKIHNTKIYQQLDQLVPPGYVVFNCNSQEHTEAMYYSSRTAYHWYPDEKQYAALKAKGIKIAAFEDHGQYILPGYMRNDPEVLIIHQQLK